MTLGAAPICRALGVLAVSMKIMIQAYTASVARLGNTGPQPLAKKIFAAAWKCYNM